VKGEAAALSVRAQRCQSHYFSSTPRRTLSGRFPRFVWQVELLRHDKRINTICMCELLEKVPKSYELFSTVMSLTLEDIWKPSEISLLWTILKCRTGRQRRLVSYLQILWCENSIFYILRTFLLHYDVKCIAQYLFQELLFFPIIILTL